MFAEGRGQKVCGFFGNLPRLKRPRSLVHPSLQLIRSGINLMVRLGCGLQGILWPLFFHLESCVSQKLNFSKLTCRKAASPRNCQQCPCPFPVSANPRGHGVKRGQTAAALGATQEVVKWLNCLHQIYLSLVIMPACSKKCERHSCPFRDLQTNASQSMVLGQQPSRGAFRNANSGAHSRPLGLETW